MKRLWLFAVPGWLATATPACLLAAVLLGVGPASAITFTASMDGLQEIPPTSSTATGSATLTVMGDLLTVNIVFSGLVGGPAVAAHSHCCTPLGTNTGVALPFTGFPNTTSGTYNQDFDLLDPAVYTATFLNDFGGGTAAGASAALLAGLEGGQAYVNIHDAEFPGGEIRGNLVPEPSTVVLV